MANLSELQMDNKMEKKRAAEKRLMEARAKHWISIFALPCICFMVASLIYSARTLGESQLAVITGLVSSVTVGLITVLQGITGAQKEDPMVSITKELVSQGRDNGTKEIIMDDKSVIIHGKNSKMVQGKDLIYGNDK